MDRHFRGSTVPSGLSENSPQRSEVSDRFVRWRQSSRPLVALNAVRVREIGGHDEPFVRGQALERRRAERSSGRAFVAAPVNQNDHDHQARQTSLQK